MPTKKMITGHRKYIATPEILWQYFMDYVDYTVANPLFKNEIRGLDYDLVRIPLARPITFKGFEVYLNMNKIISNLNDYDCNRDGKYSEYSPILKNIKDYCYQNQFEGASVGLFKENLIARSLGLTDKNEVNIKQEQPLFNLDDMQAYQDDIKED